jgi:Heavy metal associated domain 2
MNIAGEDVALEHMMPGRIRLRFRSRRGETDFFQKLVTLLSQISLIDEVDANSLTGSVLIRHSASLEQLAFLAAQSGLLPDLSSALGDPPAPRREAGSGLSAPMAVGLFALALLQLTRGRVLGSASEQFWHAERARERHAPVLSLALFGLGILQFLSGRVLAPAASLFVYGMLSKSPAGVAPVALDASAPAEFDNGDG